MPAMARPDISRLSQETLAIIGVGVALAALILTSTAGVRGEIQAVRDELRVEIRAVRTEARADREALRAEARADREAMRADHETFRNQILRLTEQQGILRARLDGISDPSAPIR
jgi:hypothetical protein